MVRELTYEEWKRIQEEWTGGLRRGTKEWRAAWRGLLQQTGDPDPEATCPATDERWQYLCSAYLKGRWVHEFRHRHHPVTRRRWIVHVRASPGWTPEVDRDAPSVSERKARQAARTPGKPGRRTAHRAAPARSSG